MNIRLHPKYGLNPTLAICFWCRKERGDIAILGARYSGEAPKHMVIDYEPCDACREILKQGIAFVEVDPRAEEKPTGRYVIVTRDFTEWLLNEDVLESVLEKGMALVDREAFDHLNKQCEKLEENQHAS